MAKQPEWDREHPEFLPSIVCYADILGFSDLTRMALGSDKSSQHLRKLRHALSKAYDAIRPVPSPGREFGPQYRMKIFTDNIVMAVPIWDELSFGEIELGSIIMKFAELQIMLAMEGFFIRGAVTFGNHYMDDDLAVGDALLEAVELDKSGDPPRIVIAPSVEAMIMRHNSFYARPWMSPHYSLLLEDPADGRMFISYLSMAFDVYPGGMVIKKYISGHKREVARNLKTYRDVTGVYKKYEWAATYHNYMCTEFAAYHPTLYHETDDNVDPLPDDNALPLTGSVIRLKSELPAPRRLSK